MKQFTTRLIGVLLCVSFLALTVPYVTTQAATYGDLSYTVSNGEITITDCDSFVTGRLSIPGIIEGYPVTGIGNEAFLFCDLTEVIIPEGVKTIGNKAFLFCSNLTSITIPASVTSIGDGAFTFCEQLSVISFVGKAPLIESSAFSRVTASVCYPSDNNTWTTTVRQNYGGTLTWRTHDYLYVSNGDATCTEAGTKTGECKYCGITETIDDIGSKGHTDSDTDYWCDVCFEYIIHDCQDEDRNYICDLCNRILEHECVDVNGDYWCDVEICEEWISHDCIDEDVDYQCDLCNLTLTHECVDDDNDYYCDYCYSLMPHKCINNNDDDWCDICYDWFIPCIDEDGDFQCDDCGDWMEHGCYDNDSDGLCDVCHQEYNVRIVGDINGDGRVNIIDVAKLYACVKGTGSLDDCLSYCDISGDGRVNIIDVAQLYAHVKVGGTI